MAQITSKSIISETYTILYEFVYSFDEGALNLS